VPRREHPRSGGSPAPRAVPDPPDRIIHVSPGPNEPDRTLPPGASPRPRGDRPGAGTAVPRSESPTPDLRWRRDPYWNYGWYRYSRWTPVYYGPWGGYFYYDPYWWDYYYFGYYPGYSYYPGYYGSYSRQYRDYDYDYGSLRLKVKPRHAQVYVDGYFAGEVDDYDGTFQRLRLKEGGHRVELRAEGYLPSIFDVLIVPGETITYDQDLRPEGPQGQR
jgi:hypothetical protein